LRCSICGQPFDPATSDGMPFCSLRCKQIDLNRWLDERYSLPSDSEEDSDAAPGSRDDDVDDA
jgi:uncharacterized protein